MEQSDQGIAPSTQILFCDDVRTELKNKRSYIGVYDGVCLVERFPLVLRQFHLVIYITSDERFDSLLFVNLTASLDGKALINHEFNEDDIKDFHADPSTTQEDGIYLYKLNLSLVSGLKVMMPCDLQVTLHIGYAKRGVYKLNSEKLSFKLDSKIHPD